MVRVFVAISVVVGGIAALAQNTPTADSKRQLPWVASPSPETERLSNALVGTWITSEKFEPNQFLKNGAAGAGTFSIHK